MAFIGYIGMLLLLFSYLLLLTKYEKHFINLGCFASFLLIVDALIIADITFSVVNCFITLTLLFKIVQNQKNNRLNKSVLEIKLNR